MVRKYLDKLTPDSDAKERINKNARHQKMSVVSQEIALSGITTVTYTKLTDDEGNPLTFSKGDIITEAGIIFTTAQVAGTSGLATLSVETSSLTNVISGFSTSSAVGTLYKVLSTQNGTSVTTMPYVVTANGSELYFGIKSTAAATAGKVKVFVEFHEIEL